MKINYILDKERAFWAAIHNLNRKSSDPQNYNFKDILKDYKIPGELRKELRQLMFYKNETEFEILNKIKEVNWGSWCEYWEENIDVLKKIIEGLKEFESEFDFSKLNDAETFFNSNFPESVNVLICPGAVSSIGRGTVSYPNGIFMFPREYNLAKKENIFKDFAVLIHEVIHILQADYYYQEDRSFIEAVTRVFAPKGIFFENRELPENSVELKMKPIVERAIKEGKTYFDVKNELLEVFNSSS